MESRFDVVYRYDSTSTDKGQHLLRSLAFLLVGSKWPNAVLLENEYSCAVFLMKMFIKLFLQRRKLLLNNLAVWAPLFPRSQPLPNRITLVPNKTSKWSKWNSFRTSQGNSLLAWDHDVIQAPVGDISSEWGPSSSLSFGGAFVQIPTCRRRH